MLLWGMQTLNWDTAFKCESASDLWYMWISKKNMTCDIRFKSLKFELDNLSSDFQDVCQYKVMQAPKENPKLK